MWDDMVLIVADHIKYLQTKGDLLFIALLSGKWK